MEAKETVPTIIKVGQEDNDREVGNFVTGLKKLFKIISDKSEPE